MAKKAAPKPETPVVETALVDVVYPRVEAKVCSATGYDGEQPITIQQAKQLLGWESEAEYMSRMIAEAPKADPESFRFGDNYLLKDEEGQKVRCWFNDKNRPFDESHCKKLAHSILKKEWAGPIAMPGETINGESIVISRTGQVKSGQHRLIGLILAYQLWKAHPLKWEDYWTEEPVLESLVVLGISDNDKVTQTLDNVKPRTLSDVFYTSDLYAALAPVGRREMARMLARSVDMLWQRTISDKKDNVQTHSESRDFVERHPTLLKACEFIFSENKKRELSIATQLTPGQVATCLYLMGSSATDGDVYRNTYPLSEKVIDWTHWDKACEFWAMMAKGEAQAGFIREALGRLVNEDTAMGGRAIEKFCVLAKAWHLFMDPNHGGITVDDLALSYVKDEYKINHLAKESIIDFGGIDLGPPRKDTDSPPPSQKDVEKSKEEIRKERAAEIAEKIKQGRENGTMRSPPANGAKKVTVPVAAQPAKKPAPKKAPKPAPKQ